MQTGGSERSSTLQNIIRTRGDPSSRNIGISATRLNGSKDAGKYGVGSPRASCVFYPWILEEDNWGNKVVGRSDDFSITTELGQNSRTALLIPGVCCNSRETLMWLTAGASKYPVIEQKPEFLSGPRKIDTE